MLLHLPLLLLVLRASASQRPLQVHVQPSGPALPSYAVPQVDFSALPTTEWTTFSHPAFPLHSVRIKRTEWCDPSAAAYTGYVDVGPRHLFFYYFDSRASPSTDPLLLWLTGGPGGSSAVGLLQELGPCRPHPSSNSNSNRTTPNPYSWNAHSNILFLDQPSGVGFSWSDESQQPLGRSEDARGDVWAFLQALLEARGWAGREFHIAGESYAGRYIPMYASWIVDQNRRADAQGLTPINLRSVLIGNGYTDVPTMMPSYYDIACTNVSVPPYLDIERCVRMKRAVPRCQRMLQESCVTILDELACGAARMFCQQELEMPTWASGRNPYNVVQTCPTDDDPVIACYPIMNDIFALLNRVDMRELLGVDPQAKNWTYGDLDVGTAFANNLDEMHPNQYYIAGLLERGVDVLIYAGTYDYVANWVGNSRWVEAMEWGGQAEYTSRSFEPWNVGGRHAGLTKRSRGLTFATVEAAGHMVPYDKPEEALAMLNRWLANRSLAEGAVTGGNR
ncbi:alpha/beta-hydrolase [Calocera cornea HHB12733]|uniref:Carboxypeptidase n=1 Tax=Calocera cornea HHB12733 TaxID=1353952 RepID=A0A165E4A9_9BASI|nr:alpha/beta-hydrolase [Calocera cornea HHB12733]